MRTEIKNKSVWGCRDVLNIYRDKIPKNSILWDDPELAFQGMLQMGHTFDDKISREIMKEIDDVSIKNG